MEIHMVIKNTAPLKDQHKTFHKSGIGGTTRSLVLVLAWCDIEI